MRYFYRLIEGVPAIPLMNAVMHRQDLFEQIDEDGKVKLILLRKITGDTQAASALPTAKKAALTLMQLVDGSALHTVEIFRLDPGAKFDWRPVADAGSFYVIGLNALPGAMCSAGDETINLRTGEFWWMDNRGGGQIANNSGDDLILLGTTIAIDK